MRLQNNIKNATFESGERPGAKGDTVNPDMIPETTGQDTFRSIAGPSEGLFKDNGSRFIARAYPVTCEDEIKSIIASLRKEYHDARHHCYAYRLGYRRDIFRANDDGEPSSSAGKPILGQIDSLELSDVLVVVIRYFGGIKLGIPGLVRAYRSATADALSRAEIIEKTASRRYRLSFGYMDMNGVMKVLKDMKLPVSGQDLGMTCSLDTEVRLSLTSRFEEAIDKTGGCSFTIIQ